MKFGSEYYQRILDVSFNDKDIQCIRMDLVTLNKAKEILKKETPFWSEEKHITFKNPPPEETSRRSFYYPGFSSDVECFLFKPIRVDTMTLDLNLKKPYRLDVYGINNGFRTITTMRFETEEKRERYFEKLKKKAESGYASSWDQLDEKISFLENELTRCMEMRNEKMKRRGTTPKGKKG